MNINNTKYISIVASCLCFLAISVQAQGNLLNNTNWGTESYPSGLAYGDVDSYGNYIATFSANGGRLYQTVSTIPGSYYYLSLSAIQYNGTNAVRVYANGFLGILNFTNQVGLYHSGENPNTPVWENFGFIFQTMDSSTMITITDYAQFDPVSGKWGAGSVGAISLTLVPEPSSVVLLGFGLVGGLAYYRCRRFKLKNRL